MFILVTRLDRTDMLTHSVSGRVNCYAMTILFFMEQTLRSVCGESVMVTHLCLLNTLWAARLLSSVSWSWSWLAGSSGGRDCREGGPAPCLLEGWGGRDSRV